MSSLESTQASNQPTEAGAAIVAALAAKYKEPPMSFKEIGIVYMDPREKWPEGLAEKVERLLGA